MSMEYPTELHIEPMKLEYEGVFDFDSLYTMILDWLKEYGFKVEEKKYKHKGSGGGAEMEISIEGQKKVTNYYKYTINVNFWLEGFKTSALDTKEGKKSISSGKIKIEVEGTLNLDYEEVFSTGFLKKVRSMYNQYIIKKEIEAIWYDTLYYRITRLHTMIKKYLDMQTAFSKYEYYLGE